MGWLLELTGGVIMYAFKVFASTLMMIMIALMFYCAVKNDKAGRVVTLLMAIVYGLGIIAIWG